MDERRSVHVSITCGIDWASDHHDVALIDQDGTLVARKRVPMLMPSAPSASAAARPRPSPKPPLAIIGTVMTSRHSWTLTHYDMGDNIIYPRVRLNTTNQVILKVKCQKRTVFWRDVSLRDVVVNIKPTKHKQTIWVG